MYIFLDQGYAVSLPSKFGGCDADARKGAFESVLSNRAGDLRSNWVAREGL